ncbi:MAG: stage II sporulation protein M [Gemmatimonadota bacterium]
MTAPGRSSVDLRERIEIETPEHVVLRYEVAGLGSRGLAAILDHLLIFLGLWALGSLASLLHFIGVEWFDTAEVLLAFLLAWGYFTAFEAWWRGQTPGKRVLRIRVVRSDGHPAGVAAAAMRNLVRVIDFLPPPYLTGILCLFFHPRARRLGDLAADTLVVRDAPESAPVVSSRNIQPVETVLAARLAPEEYRVLEEFVARNATLDAVAGRRLAAGLARRFEGRVPDRPSDPVAFLLALHVEEQARRAAGRGGTAGEIAALRLATRQEERWRTFGRIAERAASRGLDTFAAPELPDFAARYREVAADLARMRTYAAPAPLLARLERLAAAGHNALYRADDQAWRRFGPMLLRECPAAVVRAGWSVLLAVALLAGSGGAGYLALRDRPTLAEEVLPDVMLERAAAAGRRTAEGRSYAEVDEKRRSELAARLMTNNINVAIYCFAGGVLLGVGSLLVLVMNGASIGATFGHFVNVGAGQYLFSFIVGHGVLELFAICVAAAAGLRLGLALWAPGDLSRGEALTLAGRVSLRMLGAAATLLVVAGLIEGLASASGASFTYRAAVSAASAVFLVLYLLNGARWASTLDGP